MPKVALHAARMQPRARTQGWTLRAALEPQPPKPAYVLTSAPPAPMAPGTPPPVDGDTVVVAGVRLERQARPADAEGVPTAAQANMLITPSMQECMRLLCKDWRDRVPVKLQGATGTGKTAVIRYLAHKTNSPYMRVNLSYFTEVEDLLGRYVGGTSEYTEEKLQRKSDADLCRIVRQFGFAPKGGREALTALILREQGKIRWVDGPVIKAMKTGAVLLLDEINLARPEVIEALNGLFDRNQLISNSGVVRIDAHKNFRVFATQNPSSYAGRQDMSKALSSRWADLSWDPLPPAELFAIVHARYKDSIPSDLFAQLCIAHTRLAALADDNKIGQDRGGVAYTLRDLFKVAERYKRYRPKHDPAQVSDAALVAREVFEVYCGGLDDARDRALACNELAKVLPAIQEDFYRDLKLERTATGWRLGDVELDEETVRGAFVPTTDLVMTPTTVRIYARLFKALDMQENVALIGERASGKSAMGEAYAAHAGLAFYPEHYDAGMDGSRLIGTDTPLGWQDGLLVHAARHGGVLLNDEFNLAPPEILERLNSLLDDERVLVLAEKEGERIFVHPKFRFIATMNPPKYAGRHKLSRAMLNRLTCIAVPVLEKHDDLLPIAAHKLTKNNISVNAAVNDAVAKALIDLHTWVTDGYKSGALGKTLRRKEVPDFSLRQILYAVRLVCGFSGEEGIISALKDALIMGYAQAGTADDRQRVRERIELALADVQNALGVGYVEPVPAQDVAPTDEPAAIFLPGDGVYHGETKDGLAHGHGTERFLDGTTYEGQFVQGRRHGRGVLRAVDRIYTGEFKDGKLHGKGLLRFASGDRYEGEFANDTFHGKGTYFYADGNRFDGEFAEGTLISGTMYADGEQRTVTPQDGAQPDKPAYTPVDKGVARFKGSVFDLGLDTWVNNAPEARRQAYRSAAMAMREAKNRNSTSLDLRNLGLQSLPAELARLTDVTKIYLGGNDFGTLPVELCKLTKLREIHANNAGIKQIAPEILALPRLARLELVGNALASLPSSIGRATALTTLDLRANQLTQLPLEIGNLRSLYALYLNGNRLTALPESFGQMQALAELHVEDNLLRALPASIGSCTSLNTVVANNNQLRAVPASMAQLRRLCTLELQHNELRAMPDMFAQLTSLATLKLLGNDVERLPNSLVTANALHTLTLTPRGGVLPDGVGALPIDTLILPHAKDWGQRAREGLFFTGLPLHLRGAVSWE